MTQRAVPCVPEVIADADGFYASTRDQHYSKMSKDKALILLGMSSKHRRKISELKRREWRSTWNSGRWNWAGRGRRRSCCLGHLLQGMRQRTPKGPRGRRRKLRYYQNHPKPATKKCITKLQNLNNDYTWGIVIKGGFGSTSTFLMDGALVVNHCYADKPNRDERTEEMKRC